MTAMVDEMNTNSIGCASARCGSPMEAIRRRAGYYADIGDGVVRFFCSKRCAHAPAAPSSPPVQEPPLLTFAEACLAKINGKAVQFNKNAPDSQWFDWDESEMPSDMEELLRLASNSYRLKPKPAPAMGRAAEIAHERARQSSLCGGPGTEHLSTCRLMTAVAECVAKEVLDRVNELANKPMSWVDVMEQTRREFLGPSQGAGAQEKKR